MPHQCTNCSRTFPDGSKEMLSGCPDCGGNKFQFAPAAAADSATAAGVEDSPSDVDTASRAEAAPSEGPESVASRAAETVREWVGSDSEESPERTNTSPEPATESATDSLDSSTQSPRALDERRRHEETTDDADDGKQGFSEWPETARRPEDRSTATPSTADRPATEGGAAGAAETNDQSQRSSTGAETITPVESEDAAQANARSEVVPTDDLPGPTSSDSPIVDVGDSDGERAQPPSDGRVVSEPTGEQPSIEDLRAELNEQFESIKIVRPGQYELNLMELYNRDEYIISLQEDGRYVIDVPDSWHDVDE
jgi:uncharacterized protein